MSHPFLSLSKIDQKTKAEYLLAKVTAIEAPLKDGFIELLKLAQRELLRQQFKAERLLLDPILKRFKGSLEDLVVIEGQRGKVSDGKPRGIPRVAIRHHLKC